MKTCWQTIPAEMRQLKQWVVAGVDKLPINPSKQTEKASVTAPNTWATFDDAVASLNDTNPFLGFVFTESDPFTFVDLDTGKHPGWAELHADIVEKAQSFTETSLSGKSKHIVVRGKIPNGLRDDQRGVELYPSGRYMLMTGWSFPVLPISENQELLEELQTAIGKKQLKATELVDEAERVSDREVIQKLRTAENAKKFSDLYFDGNWQKYLEYQNDHSRADLGLLVMIDFYTHNIDQAVRLFKRSALYRPSKGRTNGDGTDYILRTLKTARARNQNDKKEEELKTEAFRQMLQAPKNTKEEQQPRTEKPIPAIDWPPGVMSDIAKYIYKSSPRPVKEIAISAALAFSAGIVGRQYNISGTGLNQYLIVLAPTGSGKDAAATGTGRLLRGIMQNPNGAVPGVTQFQGPGDFASGQALLKALSNQPCFFSIIGEFGLRLQQMADSKNAGEASLKRVLLGLYGKSGYGGFEGGLNYSDSTRNIESVEQPALTILGEGVPETFYEALSEDQVTSGLLPRFIIFNYLGTRPKFNKQSFSVIPEQSLIDHLSQCAFSALTLQNEKRIYSINIDNVEHLFDELDQEADIECDKGSEVDKNLWNRVHLKAMRLAGLLATIDNPISPVITEEMATWAIKTVRDGTVFLQNKFKKNQVGTGSNRAMTEVLEVMQDYLKTDETTRRGYRVNEKLLDWKYSKFIPLSYIHRRLRVRKTFKHKYKNHAQVIQDAIDALITEGDVVEVPRTELPDGISPKTIAYYLNV